MGQAKYETISDRQLARVAPTWTEEKLAILACYLHGFALPCKNHPNGWYKVTAGLMAEFGADRVRDTPISEEGFVGAGVGEAMLGERPIVEIMTLDFLLVAMDQVINHAAKIEAMFGGEVREPMVIPHAQRGQPAHRAALAVVRRLVRGGRRAWRSSRRRTRPTRRGCSRRRSATRTPCS